MGKKAFIFPGQGAQYIGMGKSFYENSAEAKEMYEEASEVTGLDLKKLCFEENDRIHITEYTQIAMLATEAAILKTAEAKGLVADFAAGLSLGEYAAILSAGFMKSRDVFEIVRKRGIYMQEAVPSGGGMSAVLGMPSEEIERICEETEGIVSIANYNCPGQIVITGEENAVTEAGEKLKMAGAKRVIPLKVSGPFHSPMLQSAGERLGEALENVEIGYGKIPYVANLTADYVFSKEEVVPLLKKQVCASVRWQQSMERLIADGVDTFYEMGPGKTLTGFLKKINKDVKAYSIDTYEDLKGIW